MLLFCYILELDPHINQTRVGGHRRRGILTYIAPVSISRVKKTHVDPIS